MSKLTRLQGLFTALCCFLMAGCVAKSASEGGVSVHYGRWFPIAILVAGILVIPIGIVVRRISTRIGWLLIVAGPIAALAFAPSLLLERAFVDDQGFEVHSGIWGMTATEKVAFNAVKSFRITQEETGGRRSRLIEVLYFEMKSGPAVRFPLNNDVKIEAGKEIVTRASRLGIPAMGFK